MSTSRNQLRHCFRVYIEIAKNDAESFPTASGLFQRVVKSKSETIVKYVFMRVINEGRWMAERPGRKEMTSKATSKTTIPEHHEYERTHIDCVDYGRYSPTAFCAVPSRAQRLAFREGWWVVTKYARLNDEYAL